MNLGIEGKTALVLGATRGLGAATARALANEGASVIAIGRDLSKLDQWMDRLTVEARARIRPTKVDLADIAALDGLIETLLSRGGVDILVNNNGGPPASNAASTPRADWLASFEAMAANLFHLTVRLLPPMQERGWGRIITIASSGVEQPIPGLAMSNAIRSSVIGWSKTLAGEVAGQGITVNVVLPGRIDTDRVAQLDAAAAKRRGLSVDHVKADSLKAIPAGRYGEPSEFGDVVAFLASERASYVTGTKIRVDGGSTRGI